MHTQPAPHRGPSQQHQEENIVERLRRRVREVRQSGFEVRIERLDEGEAGWCQVGAKRMIFLDISQTAREQLAQLNDALANYADYAESTARSVKTEPAKAA